LTQIFQGKILLPSSGLQEQCPRCHWSDWITYVG